MPGRAAVHRRADRGRRRVAQRTGAPRRGAAPGRERRAAAPGHLNPALESADCSGGHHSRCLVRRYRDPERIRACHVYREETGVTCYRRVRRVRTCQPCSWIRTTKETDRLHGDRYCPRGRGAESAHDVGWWTVHHRHPRSRRGLRLAPTHLLTTAIRILRRHVGSPAHRRHVVAITSRRESPRTASRRARPTSAARSSSTGAGSSSCPPGTPRDPKARSRPRPAADHDRRPARLHVGNGSVLHCS